jgi:hypothetical protein
MEEYQLRVVIEKAELDIKILRLRSFFRSDKSSQLLVNELDRMQSQLSFMQEYSRILQSRINNF